MACCFLAEHLFFKRWQAEIGIERERERAMRKRCLQWIAKDTYDAFMGLVWTGIFTNIYPEKETTVNLAKHTTHGWYAKESVFAYAFLHVSIVD